MRFPALGARNVDLLWAVIGPFCCVRWFWLALVVALVLVLRNFTESRISRFIQPLNKFWESWLNWAVFCNLQVLCKSSFGEASIYEALKAHADGKKLLEMWDVSQTRWLIELIETYMK